MKRFFNPVVAVALVVTATACTSGKGSPALVRTGETTTDCRHAGNAEDWRNLTSETVQFGVDQFSLVDTRATATVTSAEFLHTSGNIKLVRVALQPFGGVSQGVPWGSKDVSGDPHLVALRKSLPAHLTFTTPPPSQKGSDGRVWQVAVGVTVSGSGGRASGIRLEYTSKGKRHSITGQDSVAVYRAAAACDA